MSLFFSGSEPKTIQLNGTAVKEVWFDGKKIWPIVVTVIDEYTITGTLTTGLYWEKENADSDCEAVDQCYGNCQNASMLIDCAGEGYESFVGYKLELIFSAPIKHFPIKYISKSGATIIIEINKFKYDKEKGTYTHDFGVLKDIEQVQSIYPAEGVKDYSVFKSCNITNVNEVPEDCSEPDCQCSEEINCPDDGADGGL